MTDRQPAAARRRRLARALPVAALALALIATGCGTKVPEGELAAALGGSGAPGLGGPGAGFGGGLSGSEPGAAVGSVGPGAVGGSGGVAGGVGGTGGGSQTSGGSGAGARSEIRLGSYGTQSGIIGAALAPMPPAIRAWVADVNARGGLNGHPVRLFMQDDGGDPGRALAIARKMAEQDKVVAFFGVHGAATQHTVTPYLEEKNIPVIGGATTADSATSPVIFNPQTGGLDGIGRAFVAGLKAFTQVRDIAFMYARECGATCAEHAEIFRAYAPKAGYRIVYFADISIAAPDYTGEVLAARSAGAEALVFEVDYPTVIRVVRSAHRQDWYPIVQGNTSTYEEGFASGGADVEGTIAWATVAPYSIAPVMRPYLDAIKRYVPGGKVGAFGAEIWAGGKLFERIAPFLGEPATREQIFRGVRSLRNERLGGIVPPLTFSRGGHGKDNLCTVPVRFVRGAWTAPAGLDFHCTLDDGRVVIR